MFFLNKTIFTGFSPNLMLNDVFISLKFLLFPWNWFYLKNGKYSIDAEEKIKKYFKIKNVCLFDSGRTSLLIALKSLSIKQGDHVLVQAFTCIVVINAIKKAGGIPVYVDIEKDFNISVDNLKNKINNKTKFLIIQHTFGTPANLNELLKIAKENNLKIIEDCAHCFGIKYQNKMLGTFGDIGMLSFGSDKALSCVRGGGLITNNEKIGIKIKEEQKKLKSTNYFKIFQHLMHLPIFFIGRLTYSFSIGKLILFLAKKTCLINKIIYQAEKRGDSLPFYPTKLPNCLSAILLNQLKNIDNLNKHRKNVSNNYENKIINPKIFLPLKNLSIGDRVFLRYPILTDQVKKLKKIAKTKNIILGDWYNFVIAPKDIAIEFTGYKKGDCPKAELLTKKIVNLPTDRHIGKNEEERIIDLINSF